MSTDQENVYANVSDYTESRVEMMIDSHIHVTISYNAQRVPSYTNQALPAGTNTDTSIATKTGAASGGLNQDVYAQVMKKQPKKTNMESIDSVSKNPQNEVKHDRAGHTVFEQTGEKAGSGDVTGSHPYSLAGLDHGDQVYYEAGGDDEPNGPPQYSVVQRNHNDDPDVTVIVDNELYGRY